jgi:GNAT superfamily N-acetyltransferase
MDCTIQPPNDRIAAVGTPDVRVRPATVDDCDAVAGLAAELAQSFTFSRSSFDTNYRALLDAADVCLLVAESDREYLGYLLGFHHPTFYANGPVASAEEILVRDNARGRGVGRALMAGFEQWAAGAGCVLATVATRRAAPFYRALGYEESAAYFRKPLQLTGVVGLGHASPRELLPKRLGN